ncbi:hypothetical protein PR048_011023 [Dryococelus australis]|uniref:DDE-1 domain-containing protein n=1 Tax=Dryococelus australis TaxID=614101 RepID=A0ABQ9HKR0_9NEOP|nr:hypothetical protein PR048_011023 [Dryococelus australis]
MNRLGHVENSGSELGQAGVKNPAGIGEPRRSSWRPPAGEKTSKAITANSICLKHKVEREALRVRMLGGPKDLGGQAALDQEAEVEVPFKYPGIMTSGQGLFAKDWIPHQKIISKRGQHYSDRVRSTSQTSTSIMCAATASGYMLPPFAVYKAQNVYDLWIMEGPNGTRYSCSSSGWFHATYFEYWLFSLFLPYIQKLETDKTVVLIGGSLSSHFSVHVLQACLQHNIVFKCLPPHLTHICQSLNVSLFAPMKKIWRQILTKYNLKNSGTVQKSHFPKLLKELVNFLQPSSEETIKRCFKKCGIIPVNRLEITNN